MTKQTTAGINVNYYADDTKLILIHEARRDL